MAAKQTTYEWRVNERDEHGDCIDFDTFDTYAEALASAGSDIELTRIVGDEDGGIHYMEYATVVDGKLPEYFDEGGRVNKAHHAEVARQHATD